MILSNTLIAPSLSIQSPCSEKNKIFSYKHSWQILLWNETMPPCGQETINTFKQRISHIINFFFHLLISSEEIYIREPKSYLFLTASCMPYCCVADALNIQCALVSANIIRERHQSIGLFYCYLNLTLPNICSQNSSKRSNIWDKSMKGS